MTGGDLSARLGEVLLASDPGEKARLARAARADFAAGRLAPRAPSAPWPDAPARRDRPPLLPPGRMRRRGLGTPAGRAALLHAIAHIELNAIDLATDMAGRFAHQVPEADRQDFVLDWLTVADDEARHFGMVCERLGDLGTRYGDLPAHDGLWQAASRTLDDVIDRLAIAPLVLEARGLDVTPGMRDRLIRAGDTGSADVLGVIYEEEKAHVACGSAWFSRLCTARGLDPKERFAAAVAAHFPSGLKPPLNHEARAESRFPRDWYEDLVESPVEAG